jgi:hypothetical protein
MSEMKMTTEAEVEDFNDELSDEAIDQAEGAFSLGGSNCANSTASMLQ